MFAASVASHLQTSLLVTNANEVEDTLHASLPSRPHLPSLTNKTFEDVSVAMVLDRWLPPLNDFESPTKH